MLDEEEEDNYDYSNSPPDFSDIQDILQMSQGISVVSSDSAAMKHLNKALFHIGHGKNFLDELGYDEFNCDLVGTVSGYLVAHATKYHRLGGPKLSSLSVINYMSSMKIFCLNNFCNKHVPPCFQEAQWKKYL